MWVLAATTGMRRSELAGVSRDMLDLEHGTLLVEDTQVVVDGRAQDSDGKTEGSRRIISLDPFTVAALRKHIGMLDQERLAFGSSYPDHGKLMVFEDGRRLHPDTITSRFNRLVDLAGVRRIRLHDVRHTYATLGQRRGVAFNATFRAWREDGAVRDDGPHTAGRRSRRPSETRRPGGP
jgi:integrase